MKRYTMELQFHIEEHVPIVVHAEGSDLESCLENAEYTVDVPDPVRYHSIDNLSSSTYDRVHAAIAAEIQCQDELRAEAREEARRA